MPNSAKGNRIICWAPFIVGLAVALILGWWALPSLMMVEKSQPIAFNHVLHVEELGQDCSVCHYEPGGEVFMGLPSTADCAVCHMEIMGDHPEQARFVTEYVQTGREIRTEWLVYQKQPDNVFFTHAVHSLNNCTRCHEDRFADVRSMCNVCHLDVSTTTVPPVYRENRLSGYSEHTMIMWECEACHAQVGHREESRASNACLVCHK